LREEGGEEKEEEVKVKIKIILPNYP